MWRSWIVSWLLLAGTLIAPVVGLQQPPSSQPSSSSGDEFAGPFPSWTNLRTTYHAIGDGTTDDATALQIALNELGKPGHSPVLFIPSGRYRITRTLELNSRIWISVVGEDPGSTSIVWDGPAGGSMLRVNGVAYSRFSRLTYDGRGKASVAIEQSWDGLKPHFDTGNEYSDHYFVDVEYGIHGGFKDQGFAETSIVRSHFVRNTKAGVALGNFNALDIWIWYSTFDDCATGVTNEPGAGNFHVYGSIFRRSTVADLFMKNTGGFSARGNYSTASKAFFVSAGPIGHPATIELHGNTIVDPIDAAVIRLGNQGPGLLLDNVIRSSPRTAAPVVIWRSFIDADVTSIGNTFTAANAVSNNGRQIAFDDRVVPAGSLQPVAPTLPATLPNLKRFVVDVEPNADGPAIQRAIDRAAERIGARPIVHIPYGTYSLVETLTIPPGDLQIIGDGYPTVLKWAGSDRGPVMRVRGPSTATLRELQIDGATKADSLVIDGVDQARARVLLDGVQLRAGSESNLFADHLRRAVVQLTDFGHSYSPQGVSIKVLGSKVTIFSGASSGNGLSYEVAEGGQAVVRDMWYERDAPRGFVSVHGQARFTMQASRVATVPGAIPAFKIDNLNGTVAILTTDIDDRIAIAGSGASAKLFGLGILRQYGEAPYFENTTVPAATVLMANTRQRTKTQFPFSPATLPVRNSGDIGAPFVRAMLTDARAEVLPSPSPLGSSDVRMFRVWAQNGLNNIIIKP